MQIHEVTKGKKRTDEGILDTVKNAIMNPLSPVGFATAQQQSYHDQASDRLTQINQSRKERGLNQLSMTRGADEARSGQKLEQEAQRLADQFEQTPIFADLSTPAAAPGNRIVVPAGGGTYYLTDKGIWTNDSIPPQKITNPATITMLNNIADGGGGKEEPVPTGAPTKVKEAVSPLSQRATTRNAGVTKNPNATPTTAPVNSVSPADTNISTSVSNNDAETGKSPDEIKKEVEDCAIPALDKIGKPEFGTTAKQVEAQPEVTQAMQTLVKTSKSRAPKNKSKRVKKAFTDYAKAVLKNMEEVGTGKSSVSNGVYNSNNLGTSPQEQLQASQTLATVSGVPAGEIQKLANTVKQNPQNKNLVKQTFDLQERLQQELKNYLIESQVAISKDIHVKTKLGDYVKRVADQQWYDPKGVHIDPEKYADYIKKLDATPAAQTQYQNDTRKGAQSVDAFLKANPPSAPAAPKPADPLKQMADQQALQSQMRAHDVAQLNQQINDTTQQLRMAQIFGTGQETYLTQQLAQLIAMKV